MLDSLQGVRRGGKVVNVGGVADDLPVNMKWLMDEQVQLIGSNWFSTAQGQEIVHMVETGTLDVSYLEHVRFPLDEVNTPSRVWRTGTAASATTWSSPDRSGATQAMTTSRTHRAADRPGLARRHHRARRARRRRLPPCLRARRPRHPRPRSTPWSPNTNRPRSSPAGRQVGHGAIASSQRLRIVARMGVGLDNIAVDAAPPIAACRSPTCPTTASRRSPTTPSAWSWPGRAASSPPTARSARTMEPGRGPAAPAVDADLRRGRIRPHRHEPPQPSCRPRRPRRRSAIHTRPPTPAGSRRARLDDLLATSDIVVLHAPLTARPTT